MLDLVRNPEDRFSRDTAQITGVFGDVCLSIHYNINSGYPIEEPQLGTTEEYPNFSFNGDLSQSFFGYPLIELHHEKTSF